MKSFGIFIVLSALVYLLSLFVVSLDDGGDYIPGLQGNVGNRAVRYDWNDKFVFPDTLYSRAKFEPEVTGRSFYVDPVHGSMSNDGSRAHPWRTLEEVFSNKLIQHFRYKELPYKSGGSKVLDNPQAPVKGGDELVLLSGNHGNVNTGKGGFYMPEGKFLTIRAAEGNRPVLSSLELWSAGYICIEGLEFEFDPAVKDRVGAIINLASHGYCGETGDIIVSNCRLSPQGRPQGWDKREWKTQTTSGVLVTGDDIVVRGCRMDNIAMGISMTGDRAVVINNYINNFAVDGMRGNGSQLVFEHNYVAGSMKVDDNHDDGFQSFLTKNRSVYTDVILRNNTFVQTSDPEYPYLGDFQGIGCFDGPYKNWEIVGNTVISDDWHGITLMGAIDSMIADNIILPRNLGADKGPPWIAMTKSKSGVEPVNCSVINNKSMKYRLSPEVMQRNNATLTGGAEVSNLLKRFEENQLQFYESVFSHR